MLSKKNRLPVEELREQFKSLGKKNHSSSFIAVYLPNKLSWYRLGIIINKKISKLAVERNKLRRQIQHIVVHNFPSDFNGDILLIAKQGVLDKSHHDLEIEIKMIIQRFK